MDRGSVGIIAPRTYGPDGCSLSATRLNVSASVQHEASAIRMRLAACLDETSGDFQETQTDRSELCVPQRILTRDCGTQVE